VLVVTARGSTGWENPRVNFEELTIEHKDAVYRQMVRVCGNKEDAEDVLIEALLKAYRHLDQLRDVVAFRSWLAQIAKRVCWQLKSREALLPLMQLSAIEDEGREIADGKRPVDLEIAARQIREVLATSIAGLPAEAREVFELRDVAEIPGEEVARRLGISLAAMKSRLHRARELLRKKLDAALLEK
jgi:RNA polymerase sigma-70 factor, ECF subfamily